MTQRRRLDHFLLERAAEAGADVRDGVRVADVRADGLSVDGDEVAARVVIAADGCNGTAARALGLAGEVVHGVALEGDVPYGVVPRARFAGRRVLELGVVPGGYGWIFPKGEHVNVGVGGWGSEGPRLRGHLARLCEAHGIDVSAATGTRGYRLPMRRSHTRLADGSAAAIGDAAALVEPLSGDGMYEAFLSAKLVTDNALDLLAGRAESLEPYERQVERLLTPLADAGWSAKAAFDRYPRMTFALSRLPLTWTVLQRLLLGELAHPGAARGAERLVMEAIRAVAIRARRTIPAT